MRTSRRERRERGFTLIELVIVITILSVVAALVAGSFRGAIDMVRQQVALSDGAGESRRLMATMVEEIRVANGPGAFTMWSPGDCSFATLRGDSVRFTWSGVAGTPLIGRYNNVTDTLSRNVDSLAFAYLDSASTTAASRTVIDNVTVFLRLSRSGGQFPLKDYVHIRN